MAAFRFCNNVSWTVSAIPPSPTVLLDRNTDREKSTCLLAGCRHGNEDAVTDTEKIAGARPIPIAKEKRPSVKSLPSLLHPNVTLASQPRLAFRVAHCLQSSLVGNRVVHRGGQSFSDKCMRRRVDSAGQDDSICRVCFDPGEGLISPCLCAGSQRYIHRGCLDEWRAQERQPEAFSRCPTCKFAYIIQDVDPGTAEERWARTARFLFLATRDVGLFVLAVVASIYFCASLFYLADGEDKAAGGGLAGAFPDSWASSSRYLAAGACVFFAIVGVIGLVSIALFGAVRSRLGVQDWPLFCYGDMCFSGVEITSAESLVGCATCLAVIGVILGSLFAFVFLYLVLSKHMKVVWGRMEARRFVVVDLEAHPELAV